MQQILPIKRLFTPDYTGCGGKSDFQIPLLMNRAEYKKHNNITKYQQSNSIQYSPFTSYKLHLLVGLPDMQYITVIVIAN
jgi:hypothetical protein